MDDEVRGNGAGICVTGLESLKPRPSTPDGCGPEGSWRLILQEGDREILVLYILL